MGCDAVAHPLTLDFNAVKNSQPAYYYYFFFFKSPMLGVFRNIFVTGN